MLRVTWKYGLTSYRLCLATSDMSKAPPVRETRERNKSHFFTLDPLAGSECNLQVCSLHALKKEPVFFFCY